MTRTSGEDGVHDPRKRPTEPLDETPEERAARKKKAGKGEEDLEAQQQERAAKRKAKEEGTK